MFEHTRDFWRRRGLQALAGIFGCSNQVKSSEAPAGVATNLDCSGAASVAATARERRGWNRLQANSHTFIKLAGAPNHERYSARIRNISPGGINLEVCSPFEPGVMLSVQLPGGTTESHSDFLACVVHCAQLESNSWSIGCTFSCQPSEDQLKPLCTHPNRDQTTDQREVQRLTCDIAANFQLVAGEDQVPQSARVLNISASGVGLQVDGAIENGALLSLELRNTAATFEKTVLACVVHVTRQPQHSWILGCNFIRSISEDDLRALLTQEPLLAK
jgi:hypothetical protein